MSSRPRVAILGVGALGCLFGSRLQQSAEVTLFGRWPEQIRALSVAPLSVSELDGRTTAHSMSVADSLPEAEEQDLVVVLVKGFQTDEYADWAARLVGDATGELVSLQNGLGHRRALDAAVGRERTSYGVTYEAAYLDGPGRLHHTGTGKTWLPETPGGRILTELLRGSGCQPELTSEVETKIWQKLSVNAAFNPLTAILGIRNGELGERPELLEFSTAVGDEVARVAAALGIEIDRSRIPGIVLRVATATADNYSSMVSDLARGGPTEIDSICGAVVDAARESGIEAPYCEALCARLGAAPRPPLSAAARDVLSVLERFEATYRDGGKRPA